MTRRALFPRPDLTTMIQIALHGFKHEPRTISVDLDTDESAFKRLEQYLSERVKKGGLNAPDEDLDGDLVETAEVAHVTLKYHKDMLEKELKISRQKLTEYHVTLLKWLKSSDVIEAEELDGNIE